MGDLPHLHIPTRYLPPFCTTTLLTLHHRHYPYHKHVYCFPSSQPCGCSKNRSMRSPRTADEWRAAMEVLKGALGLRKHRLSRHVLEVILDAQPAYGTGMRVEAAPSDNKVNEAWRR